MAYDNDVPKSTNQIAADLAAINANWEEITTYLAAKRGIGVTADSTLPAFLVIPASQQANIVAGGAVTVVFGTEVKDQASNFATNTFTAPITGLYHFDVLLNISQIDGNATSFTASLITTNRTYTVALTPDDLVGVAANMSYPFSISVLADMELNETAYVSVTQTGGSNTADIETTSWFSGYLVC